MSASTISAELPAMLLEWRHCLPARPRDIWNPFEEYFRPQGLTLWVPRGDPATHPADRERRAPDGFAYFIPATLDRTPFDQTVSYFFSPVTYHKLSALEEYPLYRNH